MPVLSISKILSSNNIFLRLQTMEELSNYDPYSIKQIQFNVNKVTKYTTIKSILASLVILFITIFLSINSIRNLWCPRSQLEIYSYQNINYQPLKAFPACVVAVNIGDQLPSQMHAYQLLTDAGLTVVGEIPLSSAYDNDPNILSLANGRKFACFQLGGYYLTPSYRLKLNTSGFPDIYVKTSSYQQLIYQETYQMLKISPAEINADENTQYIYNINAKKVKAIIYDNHLPNSDPQTIINIQSSNIETYFYNYTALPNPNTTTVHFQSQRNFNLYLLVSEYIIIREDIGTILAKFLAWFSVLMIIFQILVSPIVDWSYKMTLAKQIYQNQTLSKMQTSVTSFFKFIVTKIFCKNIFQEGILHSIFQNLEKDMDILNIIKRQEIMRKLIKQNQDMETINNQNFFRLQEEKSELSLQNEQDGLSYDQIQLLTENQINSQTGQGRINQKSLSLNNSKVKFTVQKDQNANSTGIFSSIIQSLDIGQTSISLITNKGKGYGNRWNTILTVLVVVGMLAFLILAGFLTIQTNNTFKTVLNSSSGDDTQYVVTPSDFIVRMAKFNPFMDQFDLKVAIVDQNYVIQENLTLSTNCDAYRDGLNQTGSDWYCFTKNIVLSNNGRGSTRKIHIYPEFTGFFAFTFADIEFALRSSIIDEELFQFNSTISYLKTTWNSANYQTTNVQLMTKKNQTASENSIVVYLQTLKLRVASSDPTVVGQAGVTVNLMPAVLQLQQTQDTIWDVIQNSWGIVILCFTMLLSKIAKMINVRERKKITSVQQSEGRSDIISILTTQHKLQNSAFRNQLQSIGFFYKTRLPSEDLKKL